jgi:hypothetical protein
VARHPPENPVELKSAHPRRHRRDGRTRCGDDDEGVVAGKVDGVSGQGSQEIARRIAQQRQWQEAEAVRRGEQSPTDPDVLELEDMADGLRLYARQTGERMRKRLVEGRWETELVRE